MEKETKSTVSLIVVIAVALMGAAILWGIYGTIRKEGKAKFDSVYQTIDESKLALNTAIADLEEDVNKKVDKVNKSVVVFDYETDKDFEELNDKVDSYKEELVSNLEDVEENLSDKVDHRAKDLAYDMKQLNNSLDKKYRNLRDDLEDVEDEVSSAKRSINNTIEDEVSSAKRSINNNVDDEAKKVTNNVNEKFTSLNSYLITSNKDLMDKVEAAKDAINNNIDDEAKSTRTSITKAKDSIIESAVSTVNYQAGALNTGLTIIDTHLTDVFNALKPKIVANTVAIEGLSTKVDTAVETITADSQNHASNLNDGHTLLYNTLNSVSNTLGSKMDTMQATLNQILELVNQIKLDVEE